VRELAALQVKVTRRGPYIYQFIRTDKKHRQIVIVRQDADWNEGWGKSKGDSTFIVDYGKFLYEKDIQLIKRVSRFFSEYSARNPDGEDGYIMMA